MHNTLKINFNRLTDIEIYELVMKEKIHSFPSGFWINNDTEIIKKVAINLLRYLLDEKLKFNKEDIKKTVSKKFLTKHKLHTASKLFGRSAIRYVMNAYPGEFQPWQFEHDKVPQCYWADERNRIYALKYLFEVELQWNIEDIKHKLTWSIIENKGLMTLHSYYPNLYKLVIAAYPDKIKPWELMNSEVPNGTWENRNNRVLAVKWLISEINRDVKNIDRKTFAEYGLSKLLEFYYCDNHRKAIKEALGKDKFCYEID